MVRKIVHGFGYALLIVSAYVTLALMPADIEEPPWALGMLGICVAALILALSCDRGAGGHSRDDISDGARGLIGLCCVECGRLAFRDVRRIEYVASDAVGVIVEDRADFEIACAGCGATAIYEIRRKERVDAVDGSDCVGNDMEVSANGEDSPGGTGEDGIESEMAHDGRQQLRGKADQR